MRHVVEHFLQIFGEQVLQLLEVRELLALSSLQLRSMHSTHVRFVASVAEHAIVTRHVTSCIRHAVAVFTQGFQPEFLVQFVHDITSFLYQ